MQTPSSSVLYYPHIDIRDEHWLRNAALFWDSISTIVPESYRQPYSSSFAQELNDEGVLTPVRVSSEMDEIESLTDVVLDFVTDPASAGVLFGADNDPFVHIHPDKLPNEVRELVEVHPSKLPHLVRSQFRGALSNDGWVHVQPAFANFYMTLLASQLATRLGLGLVTESSAADQLSIAVNKGKPFGANVTRPGQRRQFDRLRRGDGPRVGLPRETAPGLLVDLVTRSINLPRDLPARDVLKFKNDHREELALFRREITRLTADFSEGMSVEALRQSVNDQYEAEVLPAMKSLRQSLRAQRWDAALNGFLKASFFSAAPTSAAILAGVPGSIALLVGAGVSLTASAVLLTHQTERTRMNSPYSYLLSLERRW